MFKIGDVIRNVSNNNLFCVVGVDKQISNEWILELKYNNMMAMPGRGNTYKGTEEEINNVFKKEGERI